MAPSIAVIGGGISGLAAAYRLTQRGPADMEVHVFEASPRLGGVIQTEHAYGMVVEGGPDSFLVRKPGAIRLCRDLGLDPQLLPSNPHARGAFLYIEGHLMPIPAGIQMGVPTRINAVWASPALSWWGKARMLADWIMPRVKTEPDISLGRFLAYRFGRQWTKRVAAPMLSGIYAGSIDELSLMATFPPLSDQQKRYRSLLHGARHAVQDARRRPATPATPIFMTLASGLDTLIQALADRTTAQMHLGMAMRELVREKEGFRLRGESFDGWFDGVVVATPAYAAAPLMRAESGPVAELLEGIHYANLAVVSLLYSREALGLPPDKTGILVPEGERAEMTAATFVESKWAWPSALPYLPVRVFYGRAHGPNVLDWDDERLRSNAVRDLEMVLGVHHAPTHVRVFRHPWSMPQYAVGHMDRIAQIERLCWSWPAFRLTGSAYRGVGIPDCIAEAEQAAEDVLADVLRSRPGLA